MIVHSLNPVGARNIANVLAPYTNFVIAMSKMLDDFDEPEAADAVIKPYFLEDLTDSDVSERTSQQVPPLP